VWRDEADGRRTIPTNTAETSTTRPTTQASRSHTRCFIAQQVSRSSRLVSGANVLPMFLPNSARRARTALIGRDFLPSGTVLHLDVYGPSRTLRDKAQKLLIRRAGFESLATHTL
jgi:hypothetical protein